MLAPSCEDMEYAQCALNLEDHRFMGDYVSSLGFQASSTGHCQQASSCCPQNRGRGKARVDNPSTTVLKLTWHQFASEGQVVTVLAVSPATLPTGIAREL
eukprot:3526008-Amphidinium_carterae.1